MLSLQKAILSVDKETDPKFKTDKEDNLHFKGNETRDKLFPKNPMCFIRTYQNVKCGKGEITAKELMMKWQMTDLGGGRGKAQ